MTPEDALIDRVGDLVTLGSQLGEVAEVLVSEDDAVDSLRVVRFAVRAVPHAGHCSLALLRDSQPPRTIAFTGDLAVRVDAIQFELAEGPALDVPDGEDVLQVDDLEQHDRWPRFTMRCIAETGVRSVMSLRLPLAGADRAALTFYSVEPGVFDRLDVGTASILAPFAALAVQGAVHQQDRVDFAAALQTSRRIGTAIGIIMARRLVTSDEAMALLREASQHLNRKLRDVALEVEMTGALPDYETRTRKGRIAPRPPHGAGI